MLPIPEVLCSNAVIGKILAQHGFTNEKTKKEDGNGPLIIIQYVQ